MGQPTRITRAVSKTIEILICYGKVLTPFLGFPLAAMIFPENIMAVFGVGAVWLTFFAVYLLDEGRLR